MLYARIAKALRYEQVIYLRKDQRDYIQVHHYANRNYDRLEVVVDGFCNHDEILKKGQEPERIIEVIKEYHNGCYRTRRNM